MGFLSRSQKKQTEPPALHRLPSGSFTMDREGTILTSTLAQTFPLELARDIGRQVLEAFRAAQKSQVPLAELVVYFSALKIRARELRGGAIIFFTPEPID